MAQEKCDAFGFPIPSESLPSGDPLLVVTIRKPNREQFREREIAKVIDQGESLPEDVRPIIWLIGGGSGAGKSTILASLQAAGSIPKSGVVSVNADDFKEVIPEFRQLVERGDSRAAEMVHDESNLMAREAVAAALVKRSNIIYDGTLSDHRKVEGLIRNAKMRGYEVRIIGVTARPHTALKRSLKRGKMSGRYVPVAALLFTHKRFAQFFEKYISLADSAELWKTDCTTLGEEDDVLLIAESRGGELYITHDGAYNDFQRSASLNENAVSPAEIFPPNT